MMWRANAVEARNACHASGPSTASVAPARTATVPVAAAIVRQWPPGGQRQAVWHQRQHGGGEQKERRIGKAVERRRGAEDRLLACVMQGGIERAAGPSVQHERSGRVEAGKIGPERTSIGVDRAVRG